MFRVLAWCSPLLLTLLVACGGGDGTETDARKSASAGAAREGAAAGGALEPGAIYDSPATPVGTAAPLRIFEWPLLEPQIVPPTGRGELLSATRLGQITAAAITEATQVPGVRTPVVAAAYAVTTWRITYTTLDGQGRPVTASGLMALPDKAPGRASPVVSYQHGTIFYDAEAPTNAVTPDAPPVVMASLGAIVLAADYVGYGASKGVQHPYLLSAPTAAAVEDLLTAGLVWRTQNGVRGNGQLFLVGYSEGGYATLAAQRAIEQGNGPHRDMLVATVPGAGPYDVGVTLDLLLARVRDENRLLAALLSPGPLSNLGSSVRNEVRRALFRELVPGDADVSFQSTFIDNFLADDRQAIARDSDVHDWRPQRPVALFHGRDDRTVPYAVGARALQTMQAQGAAAVSMTDCVASPTPDHLPCVAPYWQFMLGQLAPLVRDL